ncbi:MAG: double-cubane-cluster-containing anaerobic reductase [Planctomycetota bacterium]
MNSSCCGGDDASRRPCDSRDKEQSACGGGAETGTEGITPLDWFDRMIPNCLAYAKTARQQRRPIVGIMCEFTPRELIMAAGGVPVCLCGGSNATIPDAETQLPSNLCPLIKSTYGYHVNGGNPFLEMADLIVAETTCDGKKKMYELMSESRPMYVLELPQKVDDEDAAAHWLAELRKFRAFLEDRFGVTITDERLLEATETMNRERRLRCELASLMAADQPPLTGLQLLKMKSSISGLAADFEQYEKALEMFDGREPTGGDSEPVRVLMTGVPLVHGAERVLEIVEDHLGLVVAMENCTGLKPLLEEVDTTASDPLVALADKYFHLPCSVMTRNDLRQEMLRGLVDAFRPECVIELVWQACLTYDVETYSIRRFVEGELGLPYLRIETDYSPSDSARIAVRVEALFETIRAA